ncbi:MAG TPA: MFS transporter [Candidatus Saccharimonadales bacterium]|nr:MFS transporter [Candidatus Saccharimonadales bacterium]
MNSMAKTQRIVLIVSILASFVAFLDGSVVNVALPAISRTLGGGLVTQEWVVDAYLITLGSFILLAGSLSDLFGRKRILTIGLIGFGAASIMCSLAPSSIFLIVSRALQGIAGALLVPSSLALIMSTFKGSEKGKAIGQWTAWTGIAFIIGPLLGGFLVDTASWRWVFAINILPIAICLWLLRSIESPELTKAVKLDIWGAILCSVGLIGIVFSLIEQPHYGWATRTALPLAVGAVCLIAFIVYEGKVKNAMLPLSLFKVRNFSMGNVATFMIYGGLSLASFIIVIFLQQVGHFSALSAGMALLPVTLCMFLLSSRFGQLASKYGPRLFMTAGPLFAGLGYALMLGVSSDINYWTQLFPGILLFAVGLSMTVAPLTAAILGDIDGARSGIASAVNNAVARIAGLIAVAFVGVITGVHLNVQGLHKVIEVVAVLFILGSIISWLGIRNHETEQ